MPEYDVHDETLVIGRTQVEFEHPIAEVVPYDGQYIVRLEYMDLPQALDNRNIIACSQAGDRVWQIEQAPASDAHDNPYAGLGVEGVGLVGHTWRGLTVRIDAGTGTWEMHEFRK